MFEEGRGVVVVGKKHGPDGACINGESDTRRMYRCKRERERERQNGLRPSPPPPLVPLFRIHFLWIRKAVLCCGVLC